MAGFHLLGERVLDLSPRGMLISCQRPTRVGDQLLLSFRAPGPEELWFDAEAVVARVVAGQRSCDVGYGAGLEFTYFEKCARHELLSRLAGFPPPMPRRRVREAQLPRVAGWAEPVLPLVRRKRRAPRGVFELH
jgi:hypothetical protein